MKNPRRRAAAVIAAILLAGLLASLWHQRVRARESAAPSAASLPAGSPFVKVGKKQPARDFKRRSGYTVTPRAEGEKPDAESPPHPLDDEMAARAARWKPWIETKINLNYTDLPLTEVLADFTKRFGFKFLVVGDLDLQDKTVTFKVDQLAADQSIDLIFKMADLKWVLAADGTCVILARDQDAAQWEAMDSSELTLLEATEKARNQDKREAERDTVDDTYWTSVRGHVLGSEIPSAGLYDSLDSLSQTMKLNLVVSATVRKAMETEPVIPSLAAGKSLEETLDAWSAAAGTSWKVKNGLLFFGTEAEISAEKTADSKRRTERKASTDGLAALLARKVRIGGENLAIRQLATLLGNALGVPVRLDPVTWHRAARISIEETERPAEDVVRIIQSAAPVVVSFRGGILWFLAPAPPPPENR